MVSGDLSSVELTEAYLRRIERLDPLLHAVIETNPAALEIAARRDAERRAGRSRGPLHGIPVLLKDNIATNDAMESTAGSLALVGSRVPRDATIVTRLRAAGAVVLGKANLSEWANFRGVVPPPVTDGWPLSQRLERPGRLHPQPVRPGAGSVRVEFRLRGRAGGQPVRHRDRDRDRRLDRLPGREQRGRRAQADGRAGRPGRDHPDRPQPGHRRPDDPHRDRRGDRAQRAALAVRGRPRPAPPARLPGVPAARGAARRPDRGGPAAVLRGLLGRCRAQRRHGAGPRDDAIARCDARRSDRAARHHVDPRRRADRPVHRVQGRHRGVPGRPPAARRCGPWAT